MNLVQAKATLSDENPAHYKTTFAYDAAGNQVSKTGPGKITSRYTFDSLNRMVGMDAPGSMPQVNTFDSQDRRIGIASGEAEGKTFLRGACGSAILNEVSSKGKITDRYIVLPDGRLVGRVETSGNKVSFYHFDALGNTIAVSDKAGKITSTQVYEPFGASRSTPPTKGMFGFVGEHGVETTDGELMRMGARFYITGAGRFISVDPIRSIGFMARRSFSIYTYASNNPLLFIDSFGLDDCIPEDDYEYYSMYLWVIQPIVQAADLSLTAIKYIGSTAVGFLTGEVAGVAASAYGVSTVVAQVGGHVAGTVLFDYTYERAREASKNFTGRDDNPHLEGNRWYSQDGRLIPISMF